MKNTGREIDLGLGDFDERRTINFGEIGHIIENELTQNELVTLIKIIKRTYRRNIGNKYLQYKNQNKDDE